jgi:hypothetical protein
MDTVQSDRERLDEGPERRGQVGGQGERVSRRNDSQLGEAASVGSHTDVAGFGEVGHIPAGM